ncbi:hypothetical protein, partial [Streptomyces anulatus]|uniref:hypothetical protein n=1 Tax=Streptomyces anulatus TaxID=1892 RepID=UPI0036D15EED
STPDDQKARADRIAAYEASLARVYAPELESLARRLSVAVEIGNTGGGCMAIIATIGKAPASDHPLELLVTTADPGLADDRSEIVHWSAGLYDQHEGGEPLAEGHDVESFDVAVDLAMLNLRAGIPPSNKLCPCFGS